MSMLELRIINMRYHPPDVFEIGYREIFDSLRRIEIMTPLMQTFTKFIFVVELQWRKEPTMECLISLPFIADVTEISARDSTTLALLSGTFPSDSSDMIKVFSNVFECFFEFPIILERDYIEGAIVGTNANINKFLTFIEGWGADFETLSIKNYTVKGRGALSALTTQQHRCLRTAMEEGYFDIPKRNNARSVAAQLDISHATFLEHIRKAQKKIFGILFRL